MSTKLVVVGYQYKLELKYFLFEKFFWNGIEFVCLLFDGAKLNNLKCAMAIWLAMEKKAEKIAKAHLSLSFSQSSCKLCRLLRCH